MMFVSLGIGTAIAVVLIVIVSVLTGGSVKNGTSPPALVGKTLPAIREASLAGPMISSPWSSRHATVVIFFASWCGPCRTELPALSKYLATNSLGRVTVLGVDAEDSVSSGRSTLAKDHLNIPAFFDPLSNVAAGNFLIGSLPDTVFVTARGVVQNMTIGAISTKQFAAGIAALNA
jgi:thiol-disulfide isomerase/thioredoxin